MLPPNSLPNEPATNASLSRRTESVSPANVLRFTFDGQELMAREGETIAAALMAAGRRAFRVTGRRAEPRGFFCGMGICYECLVQVDGRPNVQACRIPVTEGMQVETQRGAGSWGDA
jgi:predicted molibdopterin-dependent oxidoreductase YjgC